MTKTVRHVSESAIEHMIEIEERDGWDFITATQSSSAQTISGEFSSRSFPATYLLFFRKREQQHNDVP